MTGIANKRVSTRERTNFAWLGPTVLAALMTTCGTTQAQESAERFFAGKTIRVLVGYPAGSTFDNYARVAVRHMARHVPGSPTMIVQNMPGAGGLTATANAANVAAPDGLTLALINPVNAMEPILNPDVAKFDARKFKWIGSMNTEVGTCAFWSGKVKSFKDLEGAKTRVGATGPSSGSTLDAKAVQGILGVDFQMVLGYPGLTDVRLAAEKGEVDGFCGLQVSSIKATLWEPYKSGRFNVVLQTGLKKHSDLPESIPSVFELAPNDEARQILKLIFSPWAYGAPIMAPPNTPDDRIAVLRKAFVAMISDPSFVAETRKINLEIQPMAPEQISVLVDEAYSTPEPIVSRTRALLGLVR